jgi:hypothetical protein
MLKMLDLGRAVLPVHDSFVMRNGLERELLEAMEHAMAEEFPGLTPSVKAKETMLEEIERKREAEHGEGTRGKQLMKYLLNIGDAFNDTEERKEYYRD